MFGFESFKYGIKIQGINHTIQTKPRKCWEANKMRMLEPKEFEIKVKHLGYFRGDKDRNNFSLALKDSCLQNTTPTNTFHYYALSFKTLI